MQEAIEKDQSVIKEDGTPGYVDNDNDYYEIANAVEEDNDKNKKTVSLDEV